MLDFREITLADQEWINACLHASGYRGCEYSFANNMAWRRLSGSLIARWEGYYFCTAFGTEDGIPSFIWPAGQGDSMAALREMQQFAASLGKPLRIWNISAERLSWLHQVCDGMFMTDENRDSWDYVYSSADLSSLAGRKYHQKRNFVHRFSAFGAVCAKLTESDFDDCITFAAEHYNDKLEGDQDAIAEQFAIDTYFRYFSQLGLEGITLRIDGRIVAFALGEPLNSDTFCIHIEKADTTFPGSYAAVNQAFAAEIAERGYAFINREEDLGLPGLRKAKESYHPVFMQKKYCVTFH